mmetsp:Transcript_32551/g.74893  ORF Transcript_32551/g.74893 Transcript_32551/m.74893 type:complete len:272 (-) Transcript_32551:610-1425(-)
MPDSASAASPRRTSGFHPPYSLPQVSSWLMLIYMSTCLFLYIPTLPRPAKSDWILYLYTILPYAGTLIPCLYYGYMVCTVDPVDAGRELEEMTRNETAKHCWICSKDVERSSLHCQKCGKCVAGFDHHCAWLNVCVGHGPLEKKETRHGAGDDGRAPRENYSYFVKTIGFAALHMTVHAILASLVPIGYFSRVWGVPERASEYLGISVPYPVFLACSAVALAAISLPVLLQLLVFHFCSIAYSKDAKGDQMTTYKYILEASRKRRDDQRKS